MEQVSLHNNILLPQIAIAIAISSFLHSIPRCLFMFFSSFYHFIRFFFFWRNDDETLKHSSNWYKFGFNLQLQVPTTFEVTHKVIGKLSS